MLGNIKDFISVVQDGITSNNNLRQTLQEVQKVKYIIREKSKPMHETRVNYFAGGELLDKYLQEWAEMHDNADKNAKASESVDKLILKIHDDAKARLFHANDLGHTLSSLPKLSLAVEECIDSLKDVQSLTELVEKELFDLEDLVERSNIAKRKIDHHYHLTLYKEKKLVALEEFRSKTAKENSQQSTEYGRQKSNISAEAFSKDMANYIATGALPSNVKPKTQTLSLDQVQLDDDTEDLDKFLNSS